MCLSSPDIRPKRKSGVGYKSVKKVAEGIYQCYDHSPHAGTVKYPLNRWITDPNDGEADGGCGTKAGYRTGIHLSTNLAMVRDLHSTGGAIVIIKLRFRNVTATGWDGIYGHQVVAREVYNLGEV